MIFEVEFSLGICCMYNVVKWLWTPHLGFLLFLNRCRNSVCPVFRGDVVRLFSGFVICMYSALLIACFCVCVCRPHLLSFGGPVMILISFGNYGEQTFHRIVQVVDGYTCAFATSGFWECLSVILLDYCLIFHLKIIVFNNWIKWFSSFISLSKHISSVLIKGPMTVPSCTV